MIEKQANQIMLKCTSWRLPVDIPKSSNELANISFVHIQMKSMHTHVHKIYYGNSRKLVCVMLSRMQPYTLTDNRCSHQNLSQNVFVNALYGIIRFMGFSHRTKQSVQGFNRGRNFLFSGNFPDTVWIVLMRYWMWIYTSNRFWPRPCSHTYSTQTHIPHCQH